MGYIKTKGIVIREVNTGEADKILTIFSKSHGKITGTVRGARRPRSRFVAGSQFLCYSDFVLFKGKDMYSVSSCDVIEPFYEIRNDVFRLTYAAHLAELIQDAIQENQSATKILQLFLNTLHMLTREDKNPELMVRIFELRFLSILGFTPYVQGCMECGSGDPSQMAFSYKKCGLVCRDCRSHDPYAQEISSAVCKALYHIVYSKLNEIYNFNLSDSALEELGRICRRYLKDRMERDFTKLDFLKELKSSL